MMTSLTYGELELLICLRFPMVATSLAGQTLFPMLVGVAGSAAGKKGLVSLGHIPWHLQECRQNQ